MNVILKHSYKRSKTYFVKSRLLLVFLFLCFWKRTIDQKCFTTLSNLKWRYFFSFYKIYIYNFEAFIFREIEDVIGFLFFFFFWRGQLIKSGLQRYQILNEGNLNWMYFYWRIHDTLLQNISKKYLVKLKSLTTFFNL